MVTIPSVRLTPKDHIPQHVLTRNKEMWGKEYPTLGDMVSFYRQKFPEKWGQMDKVEREREVQMIKKHYLEFLIIYNPQKAATYRALLRQFPRHTITRVIV